MPEITQNKLLKVIEEPPTGALFIFTVLSADALLPTIRSRAQVFTVRPPEESEAAVYVQNKTGMPMEEAEKLASLHRATSAECFGRRKRPRRKSGANGGRHCKRTRFRHGA